MKPSTIAAICCLLGGWLLIGDKTPGGDTTQDAVGQAFVTYEQLFRDALSDTASRLRAGELTTDTETREFISKANKAAREVAFAPMAKSEQDRLKEWTPEKHAEILEGYAK